MSSPEYEKFDITENDLEEIYNPLRKRNRMSKNQSIYGIWADSEDEGDGGEKGYGKGSRKKTRDYAAPVNFVSGGVKMGDKIEKTEDDDDGEMISDDEEEERIEMKKPLKYRKAEYKPPGHDKSKEMGLWEKHTKGIGQKLLEKMGHVPGRGLGKNLQGISAPVEAVQRRGRGAVGLYGSERKDLPPQKDEGQEENEGEFKTKLRRWKKGEKEKMTAKKYVTAEELVKLKAGKSFQEKPVYSGLSTDVSKVKVIDMTGKEQRILTGYQAISQRHNRPQDEDDSSALAQPKLFDLPELSHNLDLIIEMTEDRLIKDHKKLANEEDNLVNLEYELKRIKGLHDQEEVQITRLSEIMGILDQCSEACQSAPLVEAMEACSGLLTMLKTDYYEEYLLHDLSPEIVTIITPAVQKEFQGWEPLKNPKQGTEVMTFIKEILSGSPQPYQQGTCLGNMPTMPTQLEPFDKLMWEVIMPQIRSGVRSWNVKQPSTMLEILECWHPLMPQWMISNLLDQFIYVKLQMELEKWNPLVESIPLQSWIHPWLYIMGDRMASLYIIIRQNLARALTTWEANDPSAKVIIEPWVGVFTQSHMDVFIVKHILPKLVKCLQGICFVPQGQVCEPLKWVTSWVDIIPHKHMVDALKENFFARLLQALSSWISLGNIGTNEAMHWFQSWMGLFPSKLISDPTTKACINDAISLINSGQLSMPSRMSQGSTPFYMIDNSSYNQYRPPPPQQLKEQMLQISYEKGIPLIPIPAKSHHEQQVYKFGQILIYFQAGQVYFFENNNWSSTSSVDLVLHKAGL